MLQIGRKRPNKLLTSGKQPKQRRRSERREHNERSKQRAQMSHLDTRSLQVSFDAVLSSSLSLSLSQHILFFDHHCFDACMHRPVKAGPMSCLTGRRCYLGEPGSVFARRRHSTSTGRLNRDPIRTARRRVTATVTAVRRRHNAAATPATSDVTQEANGRDQATGFDAQQTNLSISP